MTRAQRARMREQLEAGELILTHADVRAMLDELDRLEAGPTVHIHHGVVCTSGLDHVSPGRVVHKERGE